MCTTCLRKYSQKSKTSSGHILSISWRIYRTYLISDTFYIREFQSRQALFRTIRAIVIRTTLIAYLTSLSRAFATEISLLGTAQFITTALLTIITIPIATTISCLGSAMETRAAFFIYRAYLLPTASSTCRCASSTGYIFSGDQQIRFEGERVCSRALWTAR